MSVIGNARALAVWLGVWLWLVGALSICANAAGARGRIAAAPPLAGINIGSGATAAQADADVANAAALHAKVIRTEAVWSLLEPSGPQPSEPAFAFLDRLASDASAKGIRLILIAYSTPCWASSAPTSLLGECVPGHVGKANAWPPSDPGAYASFVSYLAQRYGSRLAAIEIWNEPDQANELYFAGPEKPQRYAAILRAAYPAIKQVDPGMTVLGGSIVGSSGAFLRALYAAGIKGYYDGLSVHFYNLLLGSLRSIHEVQLANGDSTPLWLNEFGWSSCYPRQKIQQEQGCVTAQVQAQNLTNTFRELARSPFIAADVVYELTSSSSEEFGVLNPAGARKPSFGALSSVFLSPFGKASRVTLKLRRRGGRIIASGSGPVGDYMHLEVFKAGKPSYRALFVLDRFNRYSIALPAALGTRGLKVQVYQYWAGVAAGASKSP